MAVEHDIDEKMSDTLHLLMQKLMDSTNFDSTNYTEFTADESDRKLNRSKRKKRQKLRHLKNLVETKSITSLEAAINSDEGEESRGGRRGLQEKRIKRRKSLKRLKDRLMRSSITSLEEEFGSQLTFGSSPNAKVGNEKTRKNKKTKNDRYEVMEESLQRAFTELHYFQVEFGKQAHIKKKADIIAYDNQLPEWLTDPDKISPLFESYDRRLKKKEEEIKILQEHLSIIGAGDNKGKASNLENLEESLNNCRQENSRLLSKCHEFSLQVSALQDSLEKEQKNSDEVARNFKRTKQELEVALNDLSLSEKDNEKLKAETRENKNTISRLEDEIETRIPKTVHNVEMKGVKTELEEVKERHDVEMNNYKTMLKTAQVEQANSQLETASISARLAQTQADFESLCKEHSKTSDEMDVLRQRNTLLMEQYETGQTHLANTIRIAERALLERATFAQLAEREQIAAKDALNQSMREKFEMGRMEQTLRQVKVRLSTQTDDVNEKLRDHQQSHESEMMNLKREIIQLKKQLADKDQTITQLHENQRKTDLELEAVCKLAADETRFMMKDLHATS